MFRLRLFVGGLVAPFLFACMGKPEPAFHLNTPEDLVLVLHRDVLFKKDVDRCVALFSNHVLVRVLYGDVFVKLNHEQAKKVCNSYINHATKNSLFIVPEGVDKWDVDIIYSGSDRAVANVYILYKDGAMEPQGGFELRKVDGRWFVIW